MHYQNGFKSHVYLVKLIHQKKKTSTKKCSARATMVHVFVILNVRWRRLLTMLLTNRENVSNTIITCFVSRNFS